MTSIYLRLPLAWVIMVLSMSYAASATADMNVRADLERLASRTILFGHQSVGANVLDGVRQLARDAGVSVRVAEVSHANQVDSSTFGHVIVAENGKPLMKLASFERSMTNMVSGPDIALVKFCYVDFTATTDVNALFKEYEATIARLKSRHPRTRFVHVTTPLTEPEGGVISIAKRLFGRAPYGTLENLRRDEYNQLIRKTYSGRDPIFDLARVESTTEDGRTVSVEWQGRHIPVLARQYSEDGGHLNVTGRLRAARELVSVIGAVESPGRETKGTQ